MPVRPRATAVAALALALLSGLLVLLPQPAAAATTPSISELHYDDSTAAGDTGESIEVEADPGTDLTGWKIYLYNGGTGATLGKTYDNDPLPTPVTSSGVVAISYATNGIQNGGPDGMALVRGDGTVAEFLSYEGTFAATDGPATGMTSVDIGVAETNTTAPGTSLQKIDGTWTASAANSFGTKNTAVVVPVEPDGTCTGTGITNTIAEVQGTGAATTLPADADVKVTGVVTADERTGGYNGMYIQTAGTGGATRTVAAGTASDGIFVYFGTDTAKFPTIAKGDLVEVTGKPAEFNGLTQLVTDAKADTGVCPLGGTVAPVTTPMTFPLAADARESVEGMLVTPAGTTTVSDVFNTNRYGEIILAGGSDEPAPIITDVAVPGSAAANAQKAANANARFLLDDGRTTNLSSAGEAPPYFSAAQPLRVGDQVDAWGPTVLSYGFSEWRLQPTVAVTSATPAAGRTTFEPTNPRTEAPAEVGGDIKVGSFNVLNYFVHYGGDARGAANEAARLKQEDKIVAAIAGLDADVLALEEIENSIKFETDPAKAQLALETLVAAINEDEGAGTWDYVRRPAELPGADSEDFITTAIIFKTASVTPAGAPHSINDESVWFNAREPIAQTFTSGDATFTVVANHLKSKSPGTNPPTTGDNADAGDGQGNWNGDRRRQAASLTTFVEGLKASSGSDDVLMFGDFNAYTQEDPMRDIYADGYSDVATELPTGRHSYVFGGEEGSLDHALASPSMLDRITGFDIWEINAHESFAFEYDGYAPFYAADPYRASDHNPELVGIDTTDDHPEPLPGSVYVALSPCRITDTRGAGGPLAPNATLPLQVTGRPSCAIPAGATAVEASLTATVPAGNGFARLYPTGATPPQATFLNYSKARSTTNTGAVSLSEAGGVTLKNFSGPSNFVMDVQGYYISQADLPATATGSVYVALSPCRVTDTRGSGGALAPNATLPVTVTGRAGCVIPEGATGVEASVSAVGPAGNGYARLFPTGSAVPNATFLNYSKAQGTTNTGALTLNGAGSVTLKNFGGPSNFVIDVQGYFIAPQDLPDDAEGATYDPIVPCRAYDSRNDGGALAPNEQVDGFFTGAETDCPVPEGASAVEASVSAVAPSAAGYARIRPFGAAQPNATFLNYSKAQGTTNTGSLGLSEDGGLTLKNFRGPANYVIDVQGSWSPVIIEPPADTEVELQLLGINDFHGRLEPTAVPTPPATSPTVGGAAQLAGLVDQLKAENPNTGFVSAGDNIGASTFVSAVDDDNPTIDALNAAGLDVSAAGNHELDKGFADLEGRVQDRADFPILGANIYFKDGSGRALAPYAIKDIGGVKVGYVGVITEQTPSLVSPDGISMLEFHDPVAEAAAVAAQLKDGSQTNGEADIVVLLAHEGAANSTTSVADLENDPVFGEFVDLPDTVDAIFSGHTHQGYALEVPTPGGGTRPVVQTGEYGKNLAKVTLTVDTADMTVTDSTAALVPVTDITPVNADVKAIVDAAKTNSALLGAEVIGSITADIKRDPNRATESDAANFIADVQLDGTKDAGRGGAQIALMNPGGVRTDFLYAPNGEITYSEAFDVQSFSNDVFTKTFTGAEIKAVLEQQWQPAGATRPVLALGISKGLTFSYNPLATQGNRVIASTLKLNGTTLDPAGEYRVTMNSFLASGGDNFTVLAGGTNRTTPGDNDLTMLVDYFRANSPVTADTVKRTTSVPQVQILGINDFHGRIEPLTVAGAGTPPAANTTGGAAQLAGLVDKLRADNPLTDFVSAGDNIGASTFVSAVDDDKPAIDALDAAGLDVSATGNHEFDKGYADLHDRVEPLADFPILGANVYQADGTTRALDPYFVKQNGSVKVGYIGVVTEQTPSLVSPDGIAGLQFHDPVAEVEAVATQLKDGNAANGEADVIVVLAHEGAAETTSSVADLEDDPVFGEFVDLSNKVDAIFSGHTHQGYALSVPVPGGGTRPVVQTGEYGKNLAKVTLTLDPVTKDVTASTQALVPVTDITPVNADVKAIVDAAVSNAALLGSEVVGQATAAIRRDPARATESVEANFIADVQLDATKAAGRGGAQIAFMNPGGVRADIEAGEVTYSELFNVQSFSNDVFTKSFTGAQIKEVLEQQWQPAGAARPKLALGISKGFTFSYDPAAAVGSHITAMALGGVAIDPAGTYRVTMNSFLAAGGDNFTTLGLGTNRTTPGDNDLSMLVDHFRANSPVTADPVLRSTVVTGP
ncbi:hypothetical protein BH10ACT1_BH10ACT1_07230 [soil metagenome]